MSVLYELLTSPFGLPISPIWEWLILLAVGEIVHEIAWQVSPGGKFGSEVYWITKIVAFVAIWAVLYGIIMAIRFVVAHWIWFTVGGVLLLAGVIVWIVFNGRKEKRNAGNEGQRN